MQNHDAVLPALRAVAIIPAYNEAQAITPVVHGLAHLRDSNGAPLLKQIIVADNGSNDGTGDLARQAGALVVREERRGYGYACMAAIQAALADTSVTHLLFVDGDHSVLATEAASLFDACSAGAQLVIGARVHIMPGAMTLPQRFGNALACHLARWIWGFPMTDLGPFRLIERQALLDIDMQDMTYGWTVEMQVKAFQLRMRVVEVPVSVQARIGVSKVSGTVRGVIGAGIGIFSMIGKLWWRGRKPAHQSNKPESK
jgi:glycosyltransferase involved in cell wall biosynthesis